jgi:hypothetical protein
MAQKRKGPDDREGIIRPKESVLGRRDGPRLRIHDDHELNAGRRFGAPPPSMDVYMLPLVALHNPYLRIAAMHK